MSTAVRREVRVVMPWLVLAVVTAAFFPWWWSLISRGPIGVASWAPLALPVVFAARGFIPGLPGAVLIGLALGLTLAGATGRGAVFSVLALGAVMVDLASARPRLLPRVLMLSLGFLLGLSLLALGLALD
jgi:hypothetical protein